MTAELKTRSNASLRVLAAIISSARRRAGLGVLSDEELGAEVRDWAVILEPIPANRIEECALKAVRERTVKGLLQPQEVLAAWRAIRLGEAAERDSRPVAVWADELCYYCDGSGWQSVAQTTAGSRNENTYVRPCACSAAPLNVRSLVPLREPEWQKRKHSAVWERKPPPVVEVESEAENETESEAANSDEAEPELVAHLKLRLLEGGGNVA